MQSQWIDARKSNDMAGKIMASIMRCQTLYTHTHMINYIECDAFELCCRKTIHGWRTNEWTERVLVECFEIFCM